MTARPSWALPLCVRCSRECIAHGGSLCRLCFDERAKVVYWDRGAACNARGPTKAQCLLDEGHRGNHEGNGFDDYGPIYRCWKMTRPLTTTPRLADGDGEGGV